MGFAKTALLTLELLAAAAGMTSCESSASKAQKKYVDSIDIAFRTNMTQLLGSTLEMRGMENFYDGKRYLAGLDSIINAHPESLEKGEQESVNVVVFGEYVPCDKTKIYYLGKNGEKLDSLTYTSPPLLNP